jgi:hypothetical protein
MYGFLFGVVLIGSHAEGAAGNPDHAGEWRRAAIDFGLNGERGRHVEVLRQ